MSPLLVQILSVPAIGVVVCYLAKKWFERGVLKWVDEVEKRLNDADARARLHETVTDKSFASVDKRLDIGHLEFKHNRELFDSLTSRVKELEARERDELRAVVRNLVVAVDGARR